MTEDDIQAAIVAHFEASYEGVVAHFANGGRRGKIEGARFKRMGVRAGIPDLIFFTPKGTFLMEVKEPGKGRVSDAQLRMFLRLGKLGFPVAIAWSVTDGKLFMDDWRLPKRERVHVETLL